MDQQYSTLELVRHDETARAPERDYDATAFELDASALAPEVEPDTTPQLFHDSSFPEVHDKNKELTEERGPSLHKIRPGRRWLLMIMALIITAAISIGIGIGIWRHNDHNDHSSRQSSTKISPAAQYILNDTSLAALSLPNGDRHLFFQDNTGLIRRAVYTASNSQWSTSLNLNAGLDSIYFNTSSKPKNNTPLAVTVRGEDINPGSSVISMELYYVSENHTLYSNFLVEGSWIPGVSQLGVYSTAVDTRSLSVASTTSGSADRNSTTIATLLHYENPNGNVSTLSRRSFSSDGANAQAPWVDITSQEIRSLVGQTDLVQFGKPFTSGANFSGMHIGTLFSSPIRTLSGHLIICTNYTLGPGGLGTFNSDYNPGQGQIQDSAIQPSDIAMFGSESAMWVNDTQPVLYPGLIDVAPPLPDSKFPFARLASVTLADQSATFLYHQINGTTFAEEQWDASLSNWLPPVYIIVTNS